MMQDFFTVTQHLRKVWVMFSVPTQYKPLILRWRRNERDGVSNHQPHQCLLNRIFSHRWKKISKLRFTGLCEGNSPVAGEFTAQRASNAEMFPFDDVIMLCRDHSCYGLGQWERVLHSNASSHWLSPYPEWSLLCNPFVTDTHRPSKGNTLELEVEMYIYIALRIHFQTWFINRISWFIMYTPFQVLYTILDINQNSCNTKFLIDLKSRGSLYVSIFPVNYFEICWTD